MRIGLLSTTTMCDREALIGLTYEACFQVKERVKLSVRLAKRSMRQTTYLKANNWWSMATATHGDANKLHSVAMRNISRFVEHCDDDVKDLALAWDMTAQLESLEGNELQLMNDFIDPANDYVERLRLREHCHFRAIMINDECVWSRERKIRDVDAIIEDAMLIFGATAASEYIVEDISVLFAGGE